MGIGEKERPHKEGKDLFGRRWMWASAVCSRVVEEDLMLPSGSRGFSEQGQVLKFPSMDSVLIFVKPRAKVHTKARMENV